jgi:hypothetical protein
MMMIRTSAMATAVWLLATTTTICQATTQDPNSYLWENSKKANKFKHYYGDASAVLADLSSFQSLYVKVHSCV